MTDINANQSQSNIWKVVKVVSENHDINSVYLEGTNEKFTGRKAGQFVSVMIMSSDGWSEPHPFTISGAPENAILRLTIKKEGRKEGRFTSAIPDLKPGTPVKCMGPLGIPCKDIDIKPLIIMMAGGVGITPFLSVLRHFRNIKAGNKVTLFWVNKTIEDVFSSKEIEEMTQELKLTVVHCLSREDDVQSYFQQLYPRVFYEKGRLSGDILKRHSVYKNAEFYLCGPPPMMEAALKELDSLNVDLSAVKQEKFSYTAAVK
ncbi:MAG: FAD-binding oxidoreductase [Syntrophales bacterium]|jgi:NAD(P)H-flavin reductase